MCQCQVLNLAGYEGIPASTDFDIKGTVVPELSKELLSVDDFYRYGRYSRYNQIMKMVYQNYIERQSMGYQKLESHLFMIILEKVDGSCIIFQPSVWMMSRWLC